MTDSHTHLCQEPIQSNLNELLADFVNLGGKHILNVSIGLESANTIIAQSLQFENKYPQLLQTSLGIHPEQVSTDISKSRKDFKTIVEILNTHRKRINAIGECGIDYYQLQFKTELNEQEKEILKENQRVIFKEHVQLSVKENLPLTIHTRDIEGEKQSTTDALKILSTIGNGRSRGVFHSYTGDIELVDYIISLGFSIGFNGIITYPKATNVVEILKKTPLDNILLETDAPYLPPQLARNGKLTKYKYGKPEDIYEIATRVSQVKGETLEKVIDITTANYLNLFL